MASEDLFHGKYINVENLSNAVEQTKKVVGRSPLSGLPVLNFLNTGSALYETEITNARQSLFLDKFYRGDIGEPFDINNILKPITTSNNRMSLLEYENKIMASGENYYSNSNPLAFDDEALGIGSLLADLFDDIQEAISRGREIDKVRHRVHLLVRDVYGLFEANADLMASLKEEYYGSLDLTKIYYVDNNWEKSLSSDDSLRDQLIDLKTLLLTYRIAILVVANDIENPSYIRDLSALAASIQTLMDSIDDVLVGDGEDLDRLNEPLSGLRTYTAKGDKNYVNNTPRGVTSAFYKTGVFKNVKTQHAVNQLPATSSLATSYASGGPTLRDNVDVAQGSLPAGRAAVPADSVGDRAQAEGVIDTIPLTGTVGPLDENDYNKYVNALGAQESGNNYSAVNTIGYSGRWQFGAAALIDQGYVKDGTSTRGTSNRLNWTGRNGMSSRQAWLSNKQVQDAAMLDYTRRNYRSLVRLGVLKNTDSKARVAGMLMAAHLKGPGGARDFANGRDNADAYGTTTSKYYNIGVAAMGGSDVVTSTQEAVDNQNAVNRNTIPDAATFNVPQQSATPVYPYNKVREFEGGHFEEFDSTPGNERVQVRHATGTGHEYTANGDAILFATGDNYTATLGSNFMTVSGTCQIFVQGDCGITTDGDYNINAGNDINLVAGNNFNIRAGGSTSTDVAGSASIRVAGDSVSNVAGFSRVGVDGDYLLEAGSITESAKAGNFNINANDDINIVAVGMLKAIATKEVQIGSEGDVSVSAGGHAVVVAGGDASVVAGSNAELVGAIANIVAGDINTSVPVPKAEYSDTAGQAPTGSAIPVVPVATGDDNGKGAEIQAMTPEDTTQKVVDEFLPQDFETTQGHAGSGDGYPGSTKNPFIS